MKKWRRVAVAGGALAMMVGLFLPLWQRNAVAITGWDDDYFPVGPWVIIGTSLLAVMWLALPRLQRGWWMSIIGGIALIQSLLVLWRGYKLHAIGLGTWVLLAGACLLLAGTVGQRGNSSNTGAS